MPFYTSEQILNQALDEATGTLKTSGGSGAASATAANQTTTNDRLGTPGTGEPAHAGGSTGLIGWARDILAANGATGAYYVDTVTPLAANTIFTGSVRTMLPGNNRFTANFYSDTGSASLACYIFSSQDGVSYLLNDFGVTANPVVTVSIPRTANYYQISMIQSATPATVTRILSSQTP